MQKKFLNQEIVMYAIVEPVTIFVHMAIVVLMSFIQFFGVEPAVASEVLVDYKASMSSIRSTDEQTSGESVSDRSKVAAGCEVHLTPNAGQHFNLEAPMSARLLEENSTSELAFDKSKKNDLMLKIGKCKSTSLIKTNIYICDDAKTFCIAKPMQFALKSAGGYLESVAIAVTSAEKETAGHTSGTLDWSSSLERAKKENKLLFVDFFGRWCPPCNLMDETVLATRRFEELSRNFVVVKIDVDSVDSLALKSQYTVKGYPTYLIANSSGEEILRIVGSRLPGAFFKAVQQAIRYKGMSLEMRQKKAMGAGGSNEAYELGMMYLAQQDYMPALRYLNIARTAWTKGSPRFLDLEEAQLGVLGSLKEEKDKRMFSEMLWDAIRKDPISVRAFNYQETLAGVLEDLNDSNMKEALQTSRKSTIDGMLKNPKKLMNEELSTGDLYVALAQIEKEKKNEDQAIQLYVKAYDFYTNELRRLGLDEKKNRGINFDRLYCLAKAKRFEEAEKKYLEMEEVYPDEFTFFYSHARMLKDQEKFDRSIEMAGRAFKLSYGENRLRVAGFLSALYAQVNQKEKAINIIDQTLVSIQIPEDKTSRLHKELAKLEAQKVIYQKELNTQIK